MSGIRYVEEYEPMYCPMCGDPCRVLSHYSMTSYQSGKSGRGDVEEVCVDFEAGVVAVHAE